MASAVQTKPEAEAAEVLYATADHIATITLNRPERMNTISGPMLRQLTERLLEAEADRDVRVIILTGTGRAFCAGLDLSEVTRPSTSGGITGGAALATDLDLRNTPPTVLFNLGKPTICALNGSAAGYGMDTALRLRHPHHGLRASRWPRPSPSAASCRRAAAPGSCHG